MRKNYLSIIAVFSLLALMSCKGVTEQANDSTGLLSNPWEYAKNIEQSIVTPSFKDTVYNILDFGAISDSITDCSKAINDAISKCSEDGGGMVLVPQGTYLTATIHLKSNVNLHIDEGAKLLFTQEIGKYLPVVRTRFEGMECMNYSPLIYAFKQKNIAVTGKGILDGQGEIWWPWKGKKWSGSVDFEVKEDETQKNDVAILTQMVADNVPVEERIFGDGHYLRSSFISPYDCENVLIQDVKLVRSSMWILHPILCENVTVKGVRIESLGPNNDGCNPECCKNVLIEDCYFDTGDDCIAIKSGRNNDGRNFGQASENIIVKNCEMVEGHGGVVMGSEISGDVRYVFAENCIMDSPHLDRAIRIKSNSLRGGVIEHIYARNIEVKEVREAILKINMYYSKETGDHIPIARNILLENFKGFKSKHGVWIKAYEDFPATNIILRNCEFQNVEKENLIENADKLSFEEVFINGEKI